MPHVLTEEQLRWAEQFLGFALCEQDSNVAGGPEAPIETSQAVLQSNPDLGLPVISVNPNSATLDPNNHLDFTATADYPDGTSALLRDAQWSASDPAITIDASGRATARPVSVSVTITATDPQTGAQGVATVTVAPQQAVPPSSAKPQPRAEKPVLKSISVERAIGPGNNSVSSKSGGGYLKLIAIGTYSDRHVEDISGKVTWSSSDPDVKVLANGIAVASKAPTSVTITATDQQTGTSGSAAVEIPLADYNQILTQIVVEAPTSSVVGGGTLKLTATGIYADGSPRSLTEISRWESSRSEISVDPKGVATASAVTLTGPVTITAIDPDTGLFGTADLSIAPPKGSGVLLRILLAPEDDMIDVGVDVQFTASGIFDEGPPRDISGAVDWSSDKTSVKIDSTGKATALPQSDTATITATDRLSGLTGTTTVTIAPPKVRYMDMPFGQFSYWLHAEPTVKPLLRGALDAFSGAEAADAEVDKAQKVLDDAEGEIGTPEEVAKDIEQNTPPRAKDRAHSASQDDLNLGSLKLQFDDIAHRAQNAAKNYKITEQDVQGAEDKKFADFLVSNAGKQSDAFFKIAKIAVEAVKFAATDDPYSAVKAGLGIVELLGAHIKDPWLEEAQQRLSESTDIALDSTKKKFKIAIDEQEYLLKIKPDFEKQVKRSEELDKEGWETAERVYDGDKDNQGKFRFSKLKAGIDAASAVQAIVFQAEQAAFAAMKAAEKLHRLSEQPSGWMADPKTDEEIIQNMYATAKLTFDGIIKDKEHADEIHAKYLLLYKSSRDAVRKAKV